MLTLYQIALINVLKSPEWIENFDYIALYTQYDILATVKLKKWLNSRPRCEDCHKVSVLYKKPACHNYHISHHICCFKYVCKAGCLYKCDGCNIINRVQRCDGYGTKFKCYSCNNKTEITNTMWYGMDIQESCHRFCGCPISGWNGMCLGHPV